LYLKSLTLRGFKSFASTTTLQFEPGITCVVGPNGSGKSNVVDALAWVLGEQGAKSLRGGKMDDVIFAGTAARAPLGRAEVVLTIDNSDGRLPIDYSEVTLTRTMFRSGGSEYAINGRTCRLLDVQELLSDSGIGREMHVIVGQGRLDTVLHASPEDRRGFVEEAAGVLKHRKRKEKALRKLEATDGNLTRLGDLLTEIRRQLKPLGRQAEVARKAAAVQADLRDARARLLADDLVSARAALAAELADESALRERRSAVERDLTALRARAGDIDAELSADAPRMAAAQETWYHLAGLRERFLGTAGLAAERVRAASEPVHDLPGGRDPDELLGEAQRVRHQENRLADELQRHRSGLDAAIDIRRQAEQAHHDEERRLAEQTRAAAGRREGKARLQGQVHALRTRAAAAEEEIGRLATAREEAQQRADRALHDFTALENMVAGLDAGEGSLDATYEMAAAQLDDLDELLVKLREQVQASERERSALYARKEALELGLARKDGAGALLAATELVSGVLGSVAALLAVRPGYEAAVAAALGSAADAVAVDGLDSAVTAIGLLRADDLGRAGLLLASPDQAGTASPLTAPAHEPPAGAVPLLEVVEAPAELHAALGELLGSTVVVETLEDARAIVGDRPELTAVTASGDLLGRLGAAGGSASAPSLLEVQAALDETVARLTETTHEAERARFDLSRLEDERADVRARADAALAQLHDSDAKMAAVAEQLGHLGATARSARAEAERLERAIADAEQARDRDLAGLADLESRASAAEEVPDDDDADGAGLEQAAGAARVARAAETEARLALRTAEERVRALSGRADQLERTADDIRRARAEAMARRGRQRLQAATAREVGAAAQQVLTRLEHSLAAAAERRTAAEQARAAHEQQLAGVRERLRTVEDELAGLVDSVHRDEVARAEQRLRIEALERRALDDLGLDPDVLVTDYGPDTGVPVTDAVAGTARRTAGASGADGVGGDDGASGADGASGDDSASRDESAGGEAAPRLVPYDRDEQSKRLRAAERALSLLGRVNPLALEEFAALEERHAYLSEQLEDVKGTRRDLLALIDEVDERMQQVFSEAYADVAREFAAIFGRLFPGGEGRLVLTDPDSLLTTGIDVEARPAGKRVKRLSLLSGGERSLVAVTFLVALFKARPSPFYILDEVEAALDDANLGRLLTIYEELREASQLLVITHQKRTMEVGDALYGVSMRDDGVSVVISQRLREPEPA
jgi:chromosome segregation protein